MLFKKKKKTFETDVESECCLKNVRQEVGHVLFVEVGQCQRVFVGSVVWSVLSVRLFVCNGGARIRLL